MTRLEHLLTILAEEGAEVTKCATKAQRFGLETVQPGQAETNAQRLENELNDLLATFDLLMREHPGLVLEQDYRRKQAQIERYLEVSRGYGTLSD